MASKGSLGIYTDFKMVYAAYLSGAKQTTCAVPIEGRAEDLDFDEKVSEAVRNASQQLAPDQKIVYLAVPGDVSMVRSFELPMLPKKEEVTAVRFEAQKYVPFDLKDLCYDYETIPLVSTTKRIGVLFYAGRKSSIERLIACVEKADLTVAVVETLFNSLTRSFNQEIVKNSGIIYALIRVASNQTVDIVVAKNQTVLVSRHVALDHLPGTEAWDASPFIAELRLSFDFFEQNFRGQSIAKMYISCPTREGLQAVSEAAGRFFIIPIEAVSSGGNEPESAAGLAVAHGLALRDVTQYRGKKINIRGASLASQSPHPVVAATPGTFKDFLTKSLIAGLSCLVVAYFFMGQLVNSRQSELRRLTASLPASQLVSPGMDITQIQNQCDALTQKLTYFSTLVDQRRFLTVKLSALAKLVPPDIRLLSLIYDEDINAKTSKANVYMKMEGVAQSVDQGAGLSVINKFASTLRGDKGFAEGLSQFKILSAKQTILSNELSGVRFELECSSESARAGSN